MSPDATVASHRGWLCKETLVLPECMYKTPSLKGYKAKMLVVCDTMLLLPVTRHPTALLARYWPSRLQTATAAPKIADSMAISRDIDFALAPDAVASSSKCD